MDQDSKIAELRKSHAEVMRRRSQALVQLSAELFNQPMRHDAARSSPGYRDWQECSGIVCRIEAELAVLDNDEPQGLDSPVHFRAGSSPR